MLSQVNVPLESASEFYASPHPAKKSASLPYSLAANQVPFTTDTILRQPSKRLYSRRRSSQVEYLKDGRKVLDGSVIENVSAPQLWEKLLLRSWVQKIEVTVPLQESIKQKLGTLPETVECTTSTLSLVSKELLDNEEDADQGANSDSTSATKKRSHSCPKKLQDGMPNA
ncbi:hypothetical protein M3Y97_00566700 [Aphelenchoides bicaudatus]|nr:hypothetical protein M3Y97_00566700 [Aphelenchoides bicaudatus]